MALLLPKVLSKMTNNKKQTDKTNGFTQHEIKHISPSNVALFRNATDQWVLRYLMKEKFSVGWAAHQGSSVEAGVDYGVFNGVTADECVEIACDRLMDLTKFRHDFAEQWEKKSKLVDRMVRTALEQLMPLGKPALPARGSKQHGVEINARFREGEGGTVKCIGYLDFWYPEHNLVVDLKTTSKAPSGFSLDHGIQATIYKKAVGSNPDVKFLYCLTRIKDPYMWLELEDEQANKFLKIFKHNVIQMENFLSLSDDKEKLQKSVPYNPSTFYWSDAEEIKDKWYA